MFGEHLVTEQGKVAKNYDENILKEYMIWDSINIQVNLNGKKWINDNLKFKSTLYTRSPQADYDGSSTSEEGYVSDNRMFIFQTGLDHIS